MGYSLAVQHKKIIVMDHHHPYIVPREGSWHVITSAQQTNVGRNGDIHAIPLQTVGNGMVNMLTQMEESHSFNHITVLWEARHTFLLTQERGLRYGKATKPWPARRVGL
jgi:hypothetical protein